jgi:hypothetical protein
MGFFQDLRKGAANFFAGSDPHVSVFVDDIVISYLQSNEDKESRESDFLEMISEIGSCHGLEINVGKFEFQKEEGEFEALGIAISKDKMRPSKKIRQKRKLLALQAKQGDSKAAISLRGVKNYDRQVRRA